MVQLSEWITVNKLHLNLDKTCYSIVESSQLSTSDFKLYLYRREVKMVEHCKYLGIIIDCDLRWQNHIDYLYNNLIKFVSIFYKIRTKVPQDVLRMISFAFVCSHLLYGIEVYANTGRSPGFGLARCGHSKIARVCAYYLYCMWLPCWLVCRFVCHEIALRKYWVTCNEIFLRTVTKLCKGLWSWNFCTHSSSVFVVVYCDICNNNENICCILGHNVVNTLY